MSGWSPNNSKYDCCIIIVEEEYCDERVIRVCILYVGLWVCVIVSLCRWAYLWNHMSILHQLQVSGAHYLWLRPGRFETALYSVIRYGWRHICTKWSEIGEAIITANTQIGSTGQHGVNSARRILNWLTSGQHRTGRSLTPNTALFSIWPVAYFQLETHV